MKSKQVTLSIKKIKLLGVLLFFGFFLFIVFAIVEKSLAAKTSQNTGDLAESILSPTPFLPGSEMEEPGINPFYQAQFTATPRPAILFEGGDYTTPIPQPLPTMPNISPYSLPAGVNPLTGTFPATPDLLERRPIASKVTLYPRIVRPESGLTLADVVFEYYIEGGLTRFIAVFYGNNPTQIGPVRSGRFFDEHIARMYQSYLVFKYADPRVYSYLKSTDIRDFLIVPGSTACPPFFVGKNKNRDTYNNIFFNATKFAACLEHWGKDNSRPNLRSGYFSMVPSSPAEQVQSVFAHYSADDYHYWGYAPLLHKYFRYQETDNLRDGKSPNYAPLIDALTGRQVSADNLVYIFVPHTFENSYQEEDEVYHIDLFGSGKAYLFRDGIVIPAYWQRSENNQPLLITNLNGVPLSLKPGQTFYEVLGINSTIAKEDTQWHFRFDTP